MKQKKYIKIILNIIKNQLCIEIYPNSLNINLIKENILKPFNLHCYLEIEKIKNIILLTEKKNVINDYNIEIDGIKKCMIQENIDRTYLYNIKNTSHRILLSDISFCYNLLYIFSLI